jgi:hypothetical protein
LPRGASKQTTELLIAFGVIKQERFPDFLLCESKMFLTEPLSMAMAYKINKLHSKT